MTTRTTRTAHTDALDVLGDVGRFLRNHVGTVPAIALAIRAENAVDDLVSADTDDHRAEWLARYNPPRHDWPKFLDDNQ